MTLPPLSHIQTVILASNNIKLQVARDKDFLKMFCDVILIVEITPRDLIPL